MSIMDSDNNNRSFEQLEFTDEQQYLDLVKDIIANGSLRRDRTGVGTLSTFGTRMRFSLADNTIPLLTTKRVFWRGVVEELLWFIRGDTNANHLHDNGVNIWDANASTEFLSSVGLGHREQGDLGPVYGFQWRHAGATYTDMDADYSGNGVDQLSNVIETLKSNPHCRRIVMSAWSPQDIPHMALPPCHLLCQFYVDNGRLSCQMYQRSADMGLGIPFNIASYALLTHMIAHLTDLQAHELIIVTGDTHVYTSHVDALREQVKRKPRSFPKLHIVGNPKSIDAFTSSNILLTGYCPHKSIRMEMAV